MSEANGNVVVLPGTDEHRVQVTGVLLRTPRWVSDLPDHKVVYALRDGLIGRCPLARYRVPKGIRDTALVMPGIVTNATVAMLPVAAAIADRVAPWLAVHLVPRLATRNTQVRHSEIGGWGYIVGDRRYGGSGGLHNGAHNTVLVTMASPTGMLTTLCHELLHASWWRLSDAARDVLTAAVAGGTPWEGEYYRDTEERVARLFESWAGARLEGMPANAEAEFWSVEGLFQWIWEGGLADHQIVRGLVPGHEDLMRRRGLQPLPPPQPEPLPAPPPRPSIGDVVTDWIWDGCAAGVYGVGRSARWAWRKAAAAA